MPPIHDMALSLDACERQGEGLLPADPFTALQFHFGMLLGVDDFETLDAYPRGKIRLHNAWLHREGVVWGLGVGLKVDAGEIEVKPGLALDAAGRELHLETPYCINVAEWLTENEKTFDPPLTIDAATGRAQVDVHVVMRHKACLTRPVPAISDPCADNAKDVAYSRAFETAELALVAGVSKPRTLPYRRLRVLFGLQAPAPEDTQLLTDRDGVRALPAEEQPAALLVLFRRLAALDSVELEPATTEQDTVTSFPEDDTTSVLLADVVGLSFQKTADRWTFVPPTNPKIALDVRHTLVATHTIQELLCGPILEAAGGGAPPPAPAADAGGPRFSRTLTATARKLTLTANVKLAPASVDEDAFQVSTFDDEDGWASVDIKKAEVAADGLTVTIELKEALGGDWVRVIAKGTGPYPILSDAAAPLPLAGATGDAPAGTAHDGKDFVHMWKRS